MHALRFGFPVPGAQLEGDLWVRRWTGTAVMGIVNVTPDSFSDGGRHVTTEAALRHARTLLDAGALVLDVGGESTRPGAEPVPEQEELRRVVPVIEALAAEGRAIVSIDTMKPAVARAALRAGAHLVNDVTGLREPDMIAACAERRAPAVVMHMQGEPRTMQVQPRYDDVTREVLDFLTERAEAAERSGVPTVVLDPGIGFGKKLAHNLELLARLGSFVATGRPVLVGASRKRMIDVLAGVPEARDRDPGSIALHLHAASAGVAMVRVHDVAGHVQALRVWSAIGAGTASV